MEYLINKKLKLSLINNFNDILNIIYEKYIKIFDHVFNAEEKFSDVQFKKFISMIVYVSLNPNVYYNKDTIKNKTNSVYIYNESLYKSIQILYKYQ